DEVVAAGHRGPGARLPAVRRAGRLRLAAAGLVLVGGGAARVAAGLVQAGGGGARVAGALARAAAPGRGRCRRGAGRGRDAAGRPGIARADGTGLAVLARGEEAAGGVVATSSDRERTQCPR